MFVEVRYDNNDNNIKTIDIRLLMDILMDTNSFLMLIICFMCVFSTMIVRYVKLTIKIFLITIITHSNIIKIYIYASKHIFICLFHLNIYIYVNFFYV